MADDLVYALPKLRITMFGRQKLRAHADVPRFPTLPAVVCAINASGRDRDVHSIFVRRVLQDRVQTQAATAGLPLRPVRMIEESFYDRPTCAGVVRSEERGRFDAAEERVAVVRMACFQLPDLLERGVAVFGKLNVVSLGLGPVAAEVVRRAQVRAPVRAVDRGPQAASSVALVVMKRVDRAAGKIWPADGPI